MSDINDKSHKGITYNLLLILNTLKMPFLTNLQSKDICASGNKCQLKYVKYLKKKNKYVLFRYHNQVKVHR